MLYEVITKVIALYSSLTAAAAVFVLSVVPVIDPAVEIKDNSPAPTASNLTELEANWRPGRNFATTASYPAPNTTPSYVDINAPRTVTIENAPQEKDTLKPLMNISAESVRARITSYNVCYTKLLRLSWLLMRIVSLPSEESRRIWS